MWVPCERICHGETSLLRGRVRLLLKIIFAHAAQVSVFMTRRYKKFCKGEAGGVLWHRRVAKCTFRTRPVLDHKRRSFQQP